MLLLLLLLLSVMTRIHMGQPSARSSAAAALGRSRGALNTGSIVWCQVRHGSWTEDWRCQAAR